jgi:hypothetical protein
MATVPRAHESRFHPRQKSTRDMDSPRFGRRCSTCPLARIRLLEPPGRATPLTQLAISLASAKSIACLLSSSSRSSQPQSDDRTDIGRLQGEGCDRPAGGEDCSLNDCEKFTVRAETLCSFSNNLDWLFLQPALQPKWDRLSYRPSPISFRLARSRRSCTAWSPLFGRDKIQTRKPGLLLALQSRLPPVLCP